MFLLYMYIHDLTSPNKAGDKRKGQVPVQHKLLHICKATFHPTQLHMWHLEIDGEIFTHYTTSEPFSGETEKIITV